MTVSVRCHSCGTPIEAPTQARYLTCDRCGASLLLRHEGGVYFTEPVRAEDREAIAQTPSAALPEALPAARERADDSRVDRLESEVDRLHLENELLRLDADWDRDRARYMMRSRSGQLIVPSPTAGLVFAIIGASLLGLGLLGGMILALIAGSPEPLFCAFFPLSLGGALLGVGLFTRYRGLRYQEARRAYQRERDYLLDRLDELDRRERR
jgi:hypothetical protein